MANNRNANTQIKHLTYTIIIITVAVLSGTVITMLAGLWAPGSFPYNLLSSLGSGLLATAFISLILELVWSKQRTQAEIGELEPIYSKLKDIPDKLEKLEGRLEAFKQLGFNYCHSSRSEALTRFLNYAKEIVDANLSHSTSIDKTLPSTDDALYSQTTINIVSSSARGLMGHLDRDPQSVQKQWRDLITDNPLCFRILLTHPAFAHLRQPAEERASGDIELEILKTTIYLHCVAGMQGASLRFYRGSPTVFAIQVGKHILLNPYPYGKMAMDTLCLEFESENEASYVAIFTNMHFNHTWAFIVQPSKRVDGKPLVVGVDKFDHILEAFSECTFLNDPKRLRLTEAQVTELDTFIDQLRLRYKKMQVAGTPFRDFVSNNNLTFSDQYQQADQQHLDKISTIGFSESQN